MALNLYLLSQTENKDYDTFDSCIVAAEDEASARAIHPGYGGWEGSQEYWASSPLNVEVEFIGVAADGVEEGVILASFNAG